MTTDIWVAVLAVAGVITQVVVTYLISRQSANDLRANISRDIDIVRNLRLGSVETTQLEQHIGTEIANLIARDDRRERENEILRSFGSIPLVGLIVWALNVWRQHEVPRDLHIPVEVLYWLFIAVGVLVIARLIGEMLRYIYWAVRTWSVRRPGGASSPTTTPCS